MAATTRRLERQRWEVAVSRVLDQGDLTVGRAGRARLREQGPAVETRL